MEEELDVKELQVSIVSPASQKKHKKLPFTTFDIMQKRSSMPYLQRVCFFPIPPNKSDQENDVLINNMKASLAEVLVHFYPLAGRLTMESNGARPELVCNDAGVEFSVAEANICLSQVDYTQPRPWFSKLLQRGRYETCGLSSDIPFFTVQVTKFKCGSISVAWSYDHLVIDGSSQWHFITSWSQLCCGKGRISLPPKHDRFFEQEHEQLAGITPTKTFSFNFEDVSTGMEVRIFEFDEQHILKLKSLVPQGGNFAPFSAFEVVASQIWITMSKARELPASQASYHQLPVNCRSRLDPPLPEAYFGNCVLCAVAQATVGDILTGGLAFTAGIVQNAIKNFDGDEVRAKVAGYNSGSNPFTVGVTDGVHIYGGSSHRFPLYDVNFGWGSPDAVRHARSLWNGFCFYDPRPKRKPGMEVTVHLPSETMQKFSQLLFVDLDD